MARIRTIKPEFWSSPNLPADPWARLLYIAMWNHADDYGRGTATERELLGFAFPNDSHIGLAELRRALGGIRRAFGVKFYRVAGRSYYAIPSWERHQKIDKRAAASRHPDPSEGEEYDPDPTPSDLQVSSDSAGSREVPAGPPETPPSPRGTPGAGTGEQGNRGTGEELLAAPAGSAEAPTPLRSPRQPDLLWDALMAACDLDSRELTKSSRGAANAAVKQLRDVGATPEQVQARARGFRQQWPNVTLTPTALAKQWAQVRPQPARNRSNESLMRAWGG